MEISDENVISNDFQVDDDGRPQMIAEKQNVKIFDQHVSAKCTIWRLPAASYIGGSD